MTENEQFQQNARTTAILIDAGIELMRQNLRRSQPGNDASGINALLEAWLCRKEDPIPGDVAGLVHPRRLESRP